MPREPDVEDMDAVSSPATELDAAAQVTEQVAGADTAVPSPATDEAERDTSSIVREVVDARAPVAEEPGSSPEGEEVGPEAGVQVPKEPDDENFSDVPFHKHPRFQKLLHKAKTNQADAERYRNVQAFLDNGGVSADEAGEALTIAALAKRDPAGAFERIRPWLQNLLLAAGEVVPDALQQRVIAGELTQASAAEIARMQARVASVEAARQFEQDRMLRAQHMQTQNDLQNAAYEWEQDRKAKDPNFEAKRQLIMEKLAYLHLTEGRPADTAGVRSQLNRVYGEANASYRPAPAVPAQRKPAVRPVMGGQVANAAPVASDTMGIVQSVLARRGTR